MEAGSFKSTFTHWILLVWTQNSVEGSILRFGTNDLPLQVMLTLTVIEINAKNSNTLLCRNLESQLSKQYQMRMWKKKFSKYYELRATKISKSGCQRTWFFRENGKIRKSHYYAEDIFCRSDLMSFGDE